MTDRADPSALLLIDVQRDFCTGGALAVPGSEQVIEALNRYLEQAAISAVPVYASRDWHPPNAQHFAPFGGRWPVHCVRHTRGAEFHPSLALPPTIIAISKGTDPHAEGYSAFEGTTDEGEPLLADLRRRGVGHLYVGGLATDYCVKHSVLDALAAGLRVTVLADAIAGVDSDSSAFALDQMAKRGATVRTSVVLEAV